MKEINISGKILVLILICVIAVSGVVFATTIVGTSGTSAVPNYNDKMVAATTTSFVSDISNGYKEPEVSVSTESGGSSSGSSSSGSSSSLQSSYDKKQQSAWDGVNRARQDSTSAQRNVPGSPTGARPPAIYI